MTLHCGLDIDINLHGSAYLSILIFSLCNLMQVFLWSHIHALIFKLQFDRFLIGRRILLSKFIHIFLEFKLLSLLVFLDQTHRKKL